MSLGKEQIYNPSLSMLEKIYVFIFGMPIVGLRIRCRNILSLIPKNREYKKILDAGSGSGVLAFELSRRYKSAQIIGYDMNPEEIIISKAIAKKTGCPNITFQKTNILTMTDEKRFDLIVCVDILEHIEDDEEAIFKLLKALKKEGKMILHVPALYRRYPIWKKSKNFYVPSHVRYGYRLEDIQMKIEKAGFRILDIGFTYGFLETLSNNFSYMITGAQKKNKLIYAVLFPLLDFLAFIGQRARPLKLGAGIFCIAVSDTKKMIEV